MYTLLAFESALVESALLVERAVSAAQDFMRLKSGLISVEGYRAFGYILGFFRQALLIFDPIRKLL